MESKSKDLLETFIHEVLVYREPLSLALKETLGDQDSRNVMKDLTALEEKGGYISDPEVARQLGAFLWGVKRILGFMFYPPMILKSGWKSKRMVKSTTQC